MKFRHRLREAIAKAKSNLCVGIDPDLESLPAFGIAELANLGPRRFLERMGCMLVDAAHGLAPAVKFQSAYFEASGADGILAMADVIRYANSSGILTILDSKRGDISSTMRAYGRSAFEAFRADAMTVTPYMGLDVVEPLINPWLRNHFGIYLVWVSSNPGGALVQQSTHEHILERFRHFTAQNQIEDSCGLVVGATRVSALSREVRESLRGDALLVPGIGAQGGEIDPEFAAVLASNGCSLINVSRGILTSLSSGVDSWDKWGQCIREKITSYSQQLVF